MKPFLQYLLIWQMISFLPLSYLYAQKNTPTKLLRIYEDNDYLNARGKGTDKGYTAGTRFDLFYKLKRKPLLLPVFFRSRKDSVVYEASWGLMQILYTPNNINVAWFQPKDYFYSGTLVVNHSIYTFHPARHFSLLTDFLIGVRGPAAFGKQTQTFVHRLIHYTTPKGWDNQLQNAPVFNLNITIEKKLLTTGDFFEFTGGSKISVGTLQNSLSCYAVIRAGVMNDYFNGYISQFSGSHHSNKKIQAYFICKPQIQFVASDASIEGGAFAKKPVLKLDSDAVTAQQGTVDCFAKSISNFVYSIGYGAVFSSGKLALSFIQNMSSESRKETYSHEVGNLSLYVSL